MLTIMIIIIQLLSRALALMIIVNVVLSYFMFPYHPIKAALNRILEPLLAPIRKVVKPIQGFDFSPVILILTLQVIEILVIGILRSFV
ncbi:MAG: YggT family protein [Anaerolineaceae bacterium]|nr:YggT family protein [Anaerolineaceae bacterium]